MNQESDIKDLFRRVNKSISKNNKSKISEDDLNRAFVVQSKLVAYIVILTLGIFRCIIFIEGILRLVYGIFITTFL